jgi:uncharacterized protein
VSSGTPDSRPTAELQARLQRALRAALQARDPVAVSALRSVQAAIGNAEAVTPQPGSPAPGGNRHFAGVVEGLGAGEAPRRTLTEEQVGEIVRAEIAERHQAAEIYERTGHADRADRLRREADALTAAASADSPPAATPPPSEGA